MVEAARRVLLELTRLLSEYHDDIVLIGGWVPELLLSDHMGSIDVDLALNHENLKEIGYQSIQHILLKNGYIRDTVLPFRFHKKVHVDDYIDVAVDLLTGEYPSEDLKQRTMEIQDIIACKARGSDLAFSIYTEIAIEGTLPDGGKASASVRVAQILPFLVMKGMALQRNKAKDAYDIYFCL